MVHAIPQHTEMLVLILPSGQRVNQRFKWLCALSTNLHLSDSTGVLMEVNTVQTSWSPLRGNCGKTSIPEVPQEQDSRLQLMNLPAISTVLLPLEHVEQAVAPAGDFSIADVHAHGV